MCYNALEQRCNTNSFILLVTEALFNLTNWPLFSCEDHYPHCRDIHNQANNAVKPIKSNYFFVSSNCLRFFFFLQTRKTNIWFICHGSRKEMDKMVALLITLLSLNMTVPISRYMCNLDLHLSFEERNNTALDTPSSRSRGHKFQWGGGGREGGGTVCNNVCLFRPPVSLVFGWLKI